MPTLKKRKLSVKIISNCSPRPPIPRRGISIEGHPLRGNRWEGGVDASNYNY
jgi:hypothetical protein